MHELSVFRVPQCQLEKVEPILPVELDSSYAVYVDNEKMLASMIEDLNDAKELAVDLEVCLFIFIIFVNIYLTFS